MSSSDAAKRQKMASKTDDKINREKCRLVFPDHLLARVLSFCDASDFISVLQASRRSFSNALGVYLGNASSLSLSFLLRKYPNVLNNNDHQEVPLQTLMDLLRSSSGNGSKALKHLELANLRGVTGRGWFRQLSSFPLVTLDLSNNVRLDGNLLLQFLNESPPTLRHLHLTGCSQVTPAILQPLRTERHAGLLSLSIGSCSQSIRTEFIFSLLRNLRELQHLNLQGLNRIKDRVSADEGADTLLDLLPDSLKSINLTGLRLVTFVCKDGNDIHEWTVQRINELETAFDQVQNGERQGEQLRQDIDEYIWKDAPQFRIRMENLVLDGMVNLSLAPLALLLLGRQLREVHLAGCVGISNWGVYALAYNCRQTLTCFQMRGGNIGRGGLVALARYCEVLGEVDVSACMNVDDAAVVEFCRLCCRPRTNITEDDLPSLQRTKRRRLGESSSRLKVLRVAGLTSLTDTSLEAISSLDSLLILDVHDCPNLTPSSTHKAVRSLQRLVELNARDIANSSPTLAKLLRTDPLVPKCLKIVNQRVFINIRDDHQRCCSIRSQSQRLNAAVPLQSMYHCVDCGLIPSVDRGVCAECVVKCHRGHKTFLGSYTRFYCDCPFGANSCQAIFPGTSVTAGAVAVAFADTGSQHA